MTDFQLRRLIDGSLGIAMLLLIAAGASAQPASQPTSRPGARSPRDAMPFTNDNIANINTALPTLFIAGDSTAATGNPNARGWAAILADYFDTSKINLVNRGVGGARFNSYYGTPQWDRIVNAIKPGDYVAIEFGHNSGPLPGIGEETQEMPGRNGGLATTLHTHGWYLRTMIADVRAKGGVPIVSSITVRNIWKEGNVERLKEQKPGQGGMSDWSRQVAANEKTLLVDHSNIIADHYDMIGHDVAQKYFLPTDYLHTTTDGAIANCEAFVAGLKAMPDAPLNAFMNGKGQSIAAWKPIKTP